MNNYVTIDDGEEAGNSIIKHLPIILMQRRWLVIIPFVLASIAAVVAAFLLPTLYSSRAVLMVESPELPREIIGSRPGTATEERIGRIQQQVLSRGNLIEIIQQNDLYAEERASEPLSGIIEQMRSAISVQPLNPEIAAAGDNAETIAFAMSFEYKDAAKTQRVMQEFVKRFLELDASQTAEQAASTVFFLTDQARSLQNEIVALEGQITDLKARNGIALTSVGMSTVSNSGSYDAQIAALQRENALLVQQSRIAPRDPNVAAAEGQLAAARAIYSDEHPDVRIARQRLAEAQRLASSSGGNDGSMVASQIASNNAQIAALGRARSMELGQSAATASAQARAPVVMEQITQLDRRVQGLREQYKEVSDNLLTAQTVERVDTEQKGERLSVTEPPVVPDSPSSPNRPLLIAGGLLGGLFGGMVLALLAEMLMRPIRNVSELEQLLGAPPLVVVPTLGKTPWPQRLRFWRRGRTA